MLHSIIVPPSPTHLLTPAPYPTTAYYNVGSPILGYQSHIFLFAFTQLFGRDYRTAAGTHSPQYASLEDKGRIYCRSYRIV